MIDLKNLSLNDLKIDRDKIKTFFRDEHNRTYVILGSALVVAFIYLAFLIVPTFGDYLRMSRTARDLKDKINLVNSRLERIDQMKAKLELLRKGQSGYATQLPDEKEVPRFLEGLAETAKKADVKILSVTPYELSEKVPEQAGQYYGAMPIVITAKSGYHQLGHFIDELEGGGRFITVEDVKIEYDSNFPRRHNVQMVLKTYVSYEDEKKAE